MDIAQATASIPVPTATLKRRKSMPLKSLPPRTSYAPSPLRIVTLQSLLSDMPSLVNDRGTARKLERISPTSSTPDFDPNNDLPPRNTDVPTVVVSHHQHPVAAAVKRGKNGRTSSPKVKRASSLDIEVISAKKRRGPVSDTGDEAPPRSPLSSGFPGAVAANGKGRKGGRGGAASRSVSSRMASPGVEGAAEDTRRVSRTSGVPGHLRDYEVRATSDGV